MEGTGEGDSDLIPLPRNVQLWGLVIGMITSSFVILLCLKVKKSKTLELQGTVGKLIHKNPEDDVQQNSSPPDSLTVVTQHPDPRTPDFQRGHDRALPAIPRSDSLRQGDSNSELYATVGEVPNNVSNGVDGAAANIVATDSESEEVLMKSTHPYAKVKKTKKEHPYATVKKPGHMSNGHRSEGASKSDSDDDDDVVGQLRPQHNTSDLSRSSRTGSGRSHDDHPPPPSGVSRQATPLPPEPQQANFSGDSQDLNKGYSNISVREPIRHIQIPAAARAAANDSTYVTISETSDDMYAAIEDPTYVRTASQSNSDTYAVIDLPYEDEVRANPSVTDGGPPAPTARAAAPMPSPAMQHYSQVDRSKKRKNVERHSYNVEEMYAKVHKRRDDLPMGASANELSSGARPKVRSADWSTAPNNGHVHRTEINYSEFEMSMYDKDRNRVPAEPKYSKVRKPANEPTHDSSSEAGYETLPEPPTAKHNGYETVPDRRWTNGERFTGYESVTDKYNPGSDWGYETVPPQRETGYLYKSKDPGYETVDKVTTASKYSGYESISSQAKDAGYEKVKRKQPLNEPPYAKIHNSMRGREDDDDDDDESSEGYETIPMADRRRPDGRTSESDPGYEELRKARSEAGYETIGGTKPPPDYETVPTPVETRNSTSPVGSDADHPSLIHMSVREIDDGSHLRRSSVVVIERVEVSEIEVPDETTSAGEVNTHIFV